MILKKGGSINRETIRKAQKGDKKAFEEIILFYQDDLYKIARARLSDNADIDDAIQETIISAYNSIDKLLNISKLKAWLITILINKCNYIYKQKQKSNSISYENMINEKYVLEHSCLESDLEFYSLMNLLDNDEKTILILYYYEGYKSKEISKMLKMNNSTVRNKILRAKKKIENNLKEIYKYG